MKRLWLRRGLRFFTFAILFIGLAGLAVMSLWNALLPAILSVSVISFWQALGLLTLSRLLFGGFRGPWGQPGFGSPGREHQKQKLAQRFQNLTPEQRETMRQKWGGRCGERDGRARGEGRQPDSTGQPAPVPPNEPTSGPTTIH